MPWPGTPTVPHPHTGVAPKFSSPSPTALNAEEGAKLAGGESVRKQIRYEDGGRGISIMDVKGSPQDVWNVIMDFSSYPNWVDMLENTDIYFNNERNRIKVAFTLSVLGIDVAYWIDHRYDLDAGHMTWQLDYDKHSDIDDSTGYWLVYAAPNRPGFTRGVHCRPAPIEPRSQTRRKSFGQSRTRQSHQLGQATSRAVTDWAEVR